VNILSVTWLEIHGDLPDHPKTIACASLLNIDKDFLIGKLVRFWTWAEDYRENGFFEECECSLIAEKMRWNKNVKKLIEALCFVPNGENSGFLQKVNNGYQIYNWDKYIGKLIDKRRKDRERKTSGNKKEIQRNSNGNKTEFQANSTLNSDSNSNSTVPLEERDTRVRENSTEWEKPLKECSYIFEEIKGTIMPSGLSSEIKFRLLNNSDMELVKEALRLSISKQNPTAYFIKILQNWTADGINTYKQYLELNTDQCELEYKKPQLKPLTNNIFAKLSREEKANEQG